MLLTFPHLPPRPVARRPAAPRPLSSFVFRLSSFPEAFTLIELLVVIGVIAVLTALTVPTIRSLSKSNDSIQATSLIRAMISNARAIAISQHRMAGVVFFQETSKYSSPVHGNAVAMQLIIEDYDQASYGLGPSSNLTAFRYYNTGRQYLPDGIEVAMLSDFGSGIATAENAGATSSTYQQTRVLLFNADGQLTLRDGLATFDPTIGGAGQGTYPIAFGDWKFLTPSGAFPGGIAGDAYSSPGFFVYSRTEMAAQTFADDTARANWLRNHSSVVIVNANTGSVIK